MPMLRRFGGNSSMRLPPTVTEPEVWAMKPAMMRNSVVLPQPLGPSSATSSPASMSSDTRSTASAPP